METQAAKLRGKRADLQKVSVGPKQSICTTCWSDFQGRMPLPQRSPWAQAVLAAKLLILYSVEHFILLSYRMGKYIILFFPKKHKKRSTTLHLWYECVFPGTC